MDAMCHKINCWDRDVHRYIESSRIESYHPFHHYLDTLPAWDGTDRITPLAQRVSHRHLWVIGFHRWMLGMVAQWSGMSTGTANSVAPILISSRQGWGKSTFVRNLLPPELKAYFTEAYDLNAATTCVRQLATFGLISLDEFDKMPARRMPQLKSLMQMQELRVRKAYQPQEEVLGRMASFIGTSNRRDLLTDASGSRRFLCIELEHPISRDAIEYDQVYAQLKAELDRGDRYWFDKREEAAIQEHNKDYYVQSPVEDVFRECFEPVAVTSRQRRQRQSGKGAVRQLTAAEIFAIMKQRNAAALRGVTTSMFARILPTLAPHIHTQYSNGYWVRERSPRQPNV